MEKKELAIPPEQKAEIEHKLLIWALLKNGTNLSSNLGRELGNIAKELGVPLPMLQKVGQSLLHEMVNTVFDQMKKTE